MSSRGLPLKEKASYTPDIPSPLNPSSPDPPLSRCRRCRIARSEQSPTQKLMRYKAAVAWRSMVSREALIRTDIQNTRDEIRADITDTDEQKEDTGPPTHTVATEHGTLAIPIGKYEADIGVRDVVDTEKQGIIGDDYREISLDTSGYLLHILTTRLLAIAVGFVLFIGVLSAVRAVGRIEAWRTW
ncbi:hypothetical protein GGR53DRAFT_140248 [Hypoxylon sp. FL1150]|nr:hypothetical protein GGR53DRAFT_140248 [Hypoxylon sp. FL1150]